MTRLALALTLALAGVAGAAAADPVPSLFAGADPYALVDGGNVWLYPTDDGTKLNAWRCRYKAGTGWRCDDAATILRQQDIGWIKADGAPAHALWAPDMLHAHGGYYFYYAVGPQRPTPSRIGVAICRSATGPCTDSGKPLVTGGAGFEAIDPEVFIDPKTGTALLFAGGSAGATLKVWELGADLVSIKRELTTPQPPLFTEGVFLHQRDGIYYLSWSHGHYDRADYSVHYATGPSPLGPWRYRGVLLQSDSRFKGPGHHAFFQDPKSGDWYIAYHRWENQSGDGPYAGQRRVAIQRITYLPDGEIAPISME
jgi:beta-xylosidase